MKKETLPTGQIIAYTYDDARNRKTKKVTKNGVTTTEKVANTGQDLEVQLQMLARRGNGYNRQNFKLAQHLIGWQNPLYLGLTPFPSKNPTLHNSPFSINLKSKYYLQLNVSYFAKSNLKEVSECRIRLNCI